MYSSYISIQGLISMHNTTMEEKCITRIFHHDTSDEDETLSLCDLPIYSENDDYKEDFNTPSSSDEEIENFEFFSQEWSSPISLSPAADNIVFCGKLIANKDDKQQVSSDDQHGSIKQTEQQNLGVLQWSLNSKTSYQKGKCMNKISTGLSYGPSFSSKSNYCTKKSEDMMNDKILEQRITLWKSPTRSRWFVLLFGSTKIPAEMEIREIRRRQIKKSMSLQSNGSAKITSSKNKGVRWWKLIRALGCSNQHETMIKASYSCPPLN